MAQRRPLSSNAPQSGEPQKDASVAATPASQSAAASNVVNSVQQQQPQPSQQSSEKTDDSSDHDEPPPGSSWWQRWSHERPLPPRWSPAWWREMALVCVVFGITGSSSMLVVRPLLKEAGIDGTLREGPWSYRLACVFVLMPAYSLMLVTFGTIAGRHHYFRRVALRMWGRLLPLHKIGITAKPAPKPRQPPAIGAAASSSSSAAAETARKP